MSFWVPAARAKCGVPVPILPPSLASVAGMRMREADQPKVPMSCRLLPLGVWLHLLEFVPLGSVAGTLSRLCRAWLSGIRAEMLPRRLAVQLRSCKDQMAVTRCIKTMSARMQIDESPAAASTPDDALPSSLPPCVNRLAMLSCAGLTDKHLTEAARRFPRLSSFSLHACTRCSDDGVTAVLDRYGQQLVSFSLGHLVRCGRVTEQSVLALLEVLRTAQPGNSASLLELELIDLPTRILDASVLLLLLAALPRVSPRPALAALDSENRGGSAPAAAASPPASSQTLKTFSLRKLRLERRMPVGDDEDVNRAFWRAAEEGITTASSKQAGASTGSLPRSVSLAHAMEDGDDFVTDKVLGVLGGGSFARLEVLSLAGMCEWQSAALQDLLRQLPALHSLDLSRCEQVDDKMIKLVIARSIGPRLRSLSLRACPRLTDLCCASLTRSYFPRLEHLWLPATVTREAVRQLRTASGAFVAHPFVDLDEGDDDGAEPIQVPIRTSGLVLPPLTRRTISTAFAFRDREVEVELDNVPDAELTVDQWSAKYLPSTIFRK